MTSVAHLLEEYCQEAARNRGVVGRLFQVGGRSVRFQFCGDSWVNELTGSLEHLRRPFFENLQYGLTVWVWDGRVPPSNHILRAYLFALTNWWFDYTGPRGELLNVHAGNVAANYHPDTATLSLVDHDRHIAFYWKRDASPVPYYEQCAPFRSLLHGYIRENGGQFVHAAAVGTEKGGVLLAGKGGSGKSTSALACLSSALSYAGDDYCIVAEDGVGGFNVHSLYCTAKVVAMTDLDRFPGLSRHVTNPRREPGEKVAVSLYKDWAGKLMEAFPLRAVLVPRITGALGTSMVACSASEALMAIAPSTMSQLPFSGREDLRFLGAMVRSLPCYELLLGRDLRQVPATILSLLRELGVECCQDARPEEVVSAGYLAH